MDKSAASNNANENAEYLMTHESTEVERLSIQHTILTDSMGGLFFAPVNLAIPGLKILDLATANGIWLQDLSAHTKADHTYIGTDIAPEMFPKELPPSVTLVIQSNLDPWPSTWYENFDFVHQRFGLATSGQTHVKDVLNKIIQLVRPGGWVEFVEADMTGGPNSKGEAMAQFGELSKFVFSAMGIQIDFPFHLRNWLKAAGFANVEEKIFDVPIGAKSMKTEFSTKSMMNFKYVARMFADATKNIPNSFKAEEIHDLPERLGRELAEHGGFQRVHVIFGQKSP